MKKVVFFLAVGFLIMVMPIFRKEKRSIRFSDEKLKDYDFLMKTMRTGIGNRKWSATPLKLLASYSYKSYSVVTIQSDGWYGREVYCRYLSSTFEEVARPVKSYVFPEWVVHCCKVDEAKYMTITVEKNAPIVDWVPILDRFSRDTLYSLSLCLAPLYGNESKWLMLAETIEHYKLQGVEHVYVYVKDIDTYSRKLLESYSRSGEAEIIFFDQRNDRIPREWQLVGVQDCLQRSRHHSKRSIFADIDERMLPSTNTTLTIFSEKLFNNDPRLALLEFRPQWVFRDKQVPEKYLGVQTLNDHLPTRVFHNTTAWPPAGNTAKCIVDPEKILTMWVHNACVFYPNASKYKVPPEDAIIRHYRDLVPDNWGAVHLNEMAQLGEFKNTEYPTHLMLSLFKNIQNRLDRVYLVTLP